MKNRLRITCTAVALLSAITSAHEFWIQPDQLCVEPAELVRLRLTHGERFAGDPVPRNDAMILRYEFREQDETTAEIMGIDGGQESYLRPSTPGVVVYESGWYRNTLDAERFTSYLEEEGLGEIIERRMQLGESDLAGREQYKRCAKVLVTITGNTGPIDQRVELPLEIILDPITVHPEHTGVSVVSATVLLHGEPCEGLRVVAATESEPSNLQELSTDEKGRLRLEATQPGTWMLTTIAIERTAEPGDTEWSSYWASSVFPIIRGPHDERAVPSHDSNYPE